MTDQEAEAWIVAHNAGCGRCDRAHLRAALDDAARQDDPQWDATDAAHPAWWRGNDAGVRVLTDMIQRWVDGQDDGHGVMGSAPLQKLRTDIQSLLRVQALLKRT